jgi:glycosyltransferase involved in cell wall biosynthesis
MTSKEFTSFIIPIFNEKKTLISIVQEIGEVCVENSISHEICFVDDGSTDGSTATIEELARKHPEVRAIIFRRNFGKALAIYEGVRFSKGDYVMTMDGDLQDLPSEIPKFFDKLSQGYDVVSGWKRCRQDPLEKRLASKLFNYVTGLLSGIRLHDFNCGFKLYKREAIVHLPMYGQYHRFLPVYSHWFGYSVGEVEIKHAPRRFGASKFGIKRYFQGFFDLLSTLFLVRYFYKPMHFFSYVGGGVFGTGFLICLYMTVIWFKGDTIGSRPLLLLGVLLLILGVQLITTGLLSEYINIRTYKTNIHMESSIRYIGLMDSHSYTMNTPGEADNDC